MFPEKAHHVAWHEEVAHEKGGDERRVATPCFAIGCWPALLAAANALCAACMMCCGCHAVAAATELPAPAALIPARAEQE